MINSLSPLTYPDWEKQQGIFTDKSQDAYFAYLNSWYNANNKIYDIDAKALTKREAYIQLIKDLLHLFNAEESSDLFLKDIDFNKDEDLIYIIPYLANKLKQISQIIAEKREELKKQKIKNQMSGSSDAIEKILYEYILRNFTNKPYSYTQVPISTLQNQFPQLSSINNDFYIEVEELYDTNNYHDSDPSVPINEYFDLSSLVSSEPFSELTSDELAILITSRLLLRIAPTTLSEVFNYYLTVSPYLSTSSLSSLSANYSTSIYNQIAVNQKYLGESVYGLTAVRFDQVNEADYILSLPFTTGSNWFYWPSGDKGPDPTIIGNVFEPIKINSSNLILNRTVTGSNIQDSDLIFTNKSGTLEGAWLQGYRVEKSDDTINVTINAYDYTEFMFPWVGFNINSKDLSFKEYTLNDFNRDTFEKLSRQKRSEIINSYYSGTLPISAGYDIYLNQTNLVNNGANAGYFSDEADTISISLSHQIFNVWNEATRGSVLESFLYKFDKTDIYIGNGLNDIHWPLQSFEGGTDNLTMTLSSDTCLPINISTIDPSKGMIGAAAAQSFNSGDVIYKLSNNSENPIEAAWLGSGSITQLDQFTNAIQVYQTSAVNCAEYIDGPIQPSLVTQMMPGTYTSFVWMDKDTPADEVFYYREHCSTCIYGNSFPHNFYANQDYQNPLALNGGNAFPLNKYPCTCNAVKYSPIGSEGNVATDYSGMTDLLFADPQGLGSDFTFKNWVDTRNYDYLTSPQFAFYKINGKLDKEVGFGKGKWKNGNDTKFILKTGRRYTYYRTNFRINNNSNANTPFLIIKYPYKNISVNCGPDNGGNLTTKNDVVILIDNSRTQSLNLALVKEIANNICTRAIESKADVKISIISFTRNGLVLNYLTSDLNAIIESISRIQIPKKYPEWLTNITDGLILSNTILNTTYPANNPCSKNTDILKNLCVGLQTQIINQSDISSVANCPRTDANKTIILFTDGQETINEGSALPYANLIKANGTSIIGIDIGYYALSDTLLNKIATKNLYFNLQNYLNYSDLNIRTFEQFLITKIIGCFPVIPAWCKAIRDANGNWVGVNEPSDMVLNPGDYLAYNHQASVNYVAANTNNSFALNSIPFTINVKLDGWDYESAKFDEKNKGKKYGGKPFWGKTNTTSFTGIPIGGGVRTINEFVNLTQPEVSNSILSNGNYIRYTNRGSSNIYWNQPLSFNVTLTSQQWNKLIINKGDSCLRDDLNTINVKDYSIEQTNDPSDLVLESYNALNAAKYNFYLGPYNKPFLYNEGLYYINRCNKTFVVFTSAKILEAIHPYANLDNIHYPTVANISFPSTFVTENQTGYYLLPDKIGVPSYRGKGYTIQLDPARVSLLNSLSVENMFLDIEKYGSRNRGLTKKDQTSPVSIKNIDNRWMIEPYGSGNFGGTIINARENQKMVPYQTNYEINKNNQIGLCLQKDDVNFWKSNLYEPLIKNNVFPLTIRNELILNNFLKQLDTLLTDVGTQSYWKNDLYNNNFGLYKTYDKETTDFILTENSKDLTTEFGIRFETE